ncbi:DUF420 domain-containing protein [Lentibacillus saliphilus]|uniref:DUF420 domain-containing protein n=1 Tax=Lentibacillus saliphilus TaxID=2737028 RepID=UPI001C302067|nr:DUF420 domain-containing protein [Lentibacillus saliphilus]
MKVNHTKQRNYTPLIWGLSILIVAIILATNYIPRDMDGTIAGVSLTFLPLLNAVLNGVTFLLLLGALMMIKKKNIKAHQRLIYAAFGVTLVFFVSYLTYHMMAGSTSFGGEGVITYIYYTILISHIFLAAAVVPLALITLGHGVKMDVAKHKKIARWTMPIWLYVSLTGVIVYILISPYY